MKRLGSWLALAALLAATWVGAATFDRSTWPALVGDEATYLMQAQSLAWDHDLRYTRADYDRFVAQWGRQPEGLILQSDDGGATLQYGKPPSYAFYLAPFLRVAPVRGLAFANALLLTLIAFFAARALRDPLGPAAPLWVAVWLFASVAFASYTWAHADLFLMALSAIALSLVYGLPEGGGRGVPAPLGVRGTALRGLAAGTLLGLLAASRPFYGALLFPLLFAFPARGHGGKGGRRAAAAGVAGLALGAALTLLPALASMAQGGPWSPEYGGQRQSFDSSTGFPSSGSAEGAWKEAIAARGNHSWKPEQVSFEPRQSAWNALYFLAGRHVGVLPYFLPLLLGFSAFAPGRGRWLLPLAVLAASACFLLVRPFNFYGGGGSIANRYFLPLYPALWFLAGRRPRAEIVRPLLAALLAAPFLGPLWSHPRAFLLDAQGGYSYVSGVARRLLPYETTLSHLKPSGKDDFVHGALWVKPLTPSVAAEDGGARIHLGTPGSPGAPGIAATKPSGEGELLIGSPAPLAGVEIETLPPASSSVSVSGASSTGSGLRSTLRFGRPRAVHRMWWTDDAYYLYQLDLGLPAGALEREGGAAFTLRPLAGAPAGESSR